MAENVFVENPPDGEGFWPNAFYVDKEWVDNRDATWRAVMNNPGMQSERNGDMLGFRMQGSPEEYVYRLTNAEETGLSAYLAERV